MEWMLRIAKGFREVSRLKCQLIVATHHPVFMGKSHVIEFQRGYRKKLNRIYQDILAKNVKY